jgi:hypothetical protein
VKEYKKEIETLLAKKFSKTIVKKEFLKKS